MEGEPERGFHLDLYSLRMVLVLILMLDDVGI